MTSATGDGLFQRTGFTVAGTPVSVATIVVLIAVITLAVILSWLIQRVMSKALALRGAASLPAT